ncbi:DNA repair protein rad50 [Phtheirospermum japonicum]|uniref:DNA repair protein rad50 n=1 Tax=Phtheirospermum japonicum TaxID=374723 RepID=A0A830CTY9_9LAMI|nr:DNA repair protein rad50 [Phtheirospermum japonicum]
MVGQSSSYPSSCSTSLTVMTTEGMKLKPTQLTLSQKEGIFLRNRLRPPPLSAPRIQRGRLSFSNPRTIGELGCAQSLMPLALGVRLTSHLAVNVRACCELSHENSADNYCSSDSPDSKSQGAMAAADGRSLEETPTWAVVVCFVLVAVTIIIEHIIHLLGKLRGGFWFQLTRRRGTLSVYNRNIDRNRADLKQAHYKDIDKRYFDQLIQLKTTEMENKDLDRYYKALDKALMRFHTIKMEEINKIIRELWQQTYRGQDIDYISIHSDSDGAGTRSYNYKVGTAGWLDRTKQDKGPSSLSIVQSRKHLMRAHVVALVLDAEEVRCV